MISHPTGRDRAPHVLAYPLTIHGADELAHELQLEANFVGDPDPGPGATSGVDLHLRYRHGPLAEQLEYSCTVWGVRYEYSDGEWDPGQVDIAKCLRYLPDLLIGRGVGTLMQSYLVAWVLQLPGVPVWELTLTGEDATSPAAIERRRRFWTNFGITFVDSDDGTHQISVPMSSCGLRTPPLPSVVREGALMIPTELWNVFGQKHSTLA